MAREITVTVLLALLQVFAVRFAQLAGQQFYFSTGAVFETRSEQTVGAILFRLGIPLVAGTLVPVLVDENEYEVAIASGATAWALLMWPIAWRPALMLPHEKRGWIASLILLWWIPFSGLPVAGVATTRFIKSATSDERAGTAVGQLTIAVLSAVGLGLFAVLISKVAARRVRFADDPPSEYVEDEAHSEIPLMTRVRLSRPCPG